MYKQRPKAPELQIMLGLMTMSLILTTRRSLTKAVLASESFWNLGTPRSHLMRAITLAHSQDNIAFSSTNILNALFPNFTLLFFCFITIYICLEFSIFLSFHLLRLQFRRSKPCVFFYISQRTFLFIYLFFFLTCLILAVALRYFHLLYIVVIIIILVRFLFPFDSAHGLKENENN